MKSQDRRWPDDNGRPQGASRAKEGGEHSSIETVKRKKIGCSLPGTTDDEKLSLQDEIPGHQGPHAAKSEQSGKCGQKMGREQENMFHGGGA